MYDLLLKDAHVVDPLNGVNGVNDVAVEGGKIAASASASTLPSPINSAPSCVISFKCP